MSDCSSARITIGGTLPRDRLDDFAHAIIEHNLGAEYISPFGDEADAIAHIESCAAERQPLRLYATNVAGGIFEELEATCRSIGLAYTRGDDGHYTWSPTVDFWQPGMRSARSWIGHVDDDAPHLDAKTIRDLIATGGLAAELDLMDQAASFNTSITIAE